MEEKYIFRTKSEKEYTVIKNKLLNDKSLSWEARGMLVYLLSKPDTWIVKKQDLIESSPAAGKKTARILKELETTGYIKRNKFRNEKGQWEWHTWVFDLPNPPSILPKRGDGETILPKPMHGKGVNIVSTELEKTEIKSNEKTTTTGGNIFKYDFHILPSFFNLDILFSKQTSGKLQLIPADPQISGHFVK